MITAIKTIIYLYIAAKLAEAAIVIYLNRMIKKRKAAFERYNQKLWLARYQKTIPAWFAMTAE